jgi:hypothetical protein
LTAPGKLARFRQVDVHIRHMHHDALEFADGTIVLVARLVQGQRATVLQLPSVPLKVSEHKAAEAPQAAVPSAETIV